MFLKNPPALEYGPIRRDSLELVLARLGHVRPLWGDLRTWALPRLEIEQQPEVRETALSQAEAYDELHYHAPDFPGWLYDGEYFCVG